MLVVCVGMPRAASTWQYQVAAELVERHRKGRRLGFLPSAEVTAPAPGDWAVVKWHDSDEGYAGLLSDASAYGLYTCRDIRDVVYSAAHKTAQSFTDLVDGSFIERTFASDAFWRSQPRVLCQEYEAIVRDPVSAALELAGHLGLPVDASEAEDIVRLCSLEANIARMHELRRSLEAEGVDLARPEHALDHDERSQIHWNHVRELPHGGWRALSSPGERGLLRARASGWLIERGYEQDNLWAPPLLSVVVPTLNRAKYIRATIDSILGQDYPEIECMVVDAASTDGTLEILASYGDRIRWVSEPDRGPFDAVNKGWARTTGEICAWLSADDTYAPGGVAIAMGAFAESAEVDVVHGLCATIAPSGRVARTWGSEPWVYTQSVVGCACTIEQPAAFIRRRMIERVGGVQNIPVLDFDLWLRISAAGGTFRAVPEHLANAQDHPDRITNNPAVMVPAVVEAIRRAVADPSAPAIVKRHQARALSSAYAHGFYFVGTHKWSWVARCAAGAIRADRTNTLNVLKSLGSALERQPGSPLPVRAAAWGARQAWLLANGQRSQGRVVALQWAAIASLFVLMLRRK